MRKLVIAPRGQWERGNGERVTIGMMGDSHLTNALKIVDAKLEQARTTLSRAREMHAADTSVMRMSDKIAASEFKKIEMLIASLEAKATELQAEISRRHSPAAP